MAERHGLSDDTAPTVSVVIPAYNAANYIDEALKSVLNQTFTSHEIILINDGSPDTRELEYKLRRFAGKIRYIQQENRGAAAARNAGLRAARGEFVAFLDADDRWWPNFLEDQIKFLEHSNADVVYADAVLTGQFPSAGRTFMQVQPSRGEVTPESLLAVQVAVLTSTVVARKNHVLDVGLFDERLKRGHDFELWLRLARAGARFAYQGKVLADHRIVESSLSGDTISQLERTLTVLNAVKNRGELTETEDAAFHATLNRTLAQLATEKGRQKLLARDFRGAARDFHEARGFRDSWKLKAVCLGLKVAPRALWWFQHRRLTAPNEPIDHQTVE